MKQKASTAFGDLLPAGNETDKVIYYLSSLVSNISPRYAPSRLDWTYELGKSKKLTSILRTISTNLILAHATPTQANAPAGPESSIDSEKYREDFKDTEFTFQTVTQDFMDRTSASTRVSFRNVSPSQYSSILAAMQKLAATERDRSTPVPGAPEVPTPDNV